MTDNEATHYDARQALQIAMHIARPRRVGSQAENQVGRELASRLEQSGLRVHAEPFRFSDASTIFLKLEIIACQVLIAAAMCLYAIDSSVRTVTAALLILLPVLFNKLNRAVQQGSLDEGQNHTAWRSLCHRLGRSYHATTYVARLPRAYGDASATHLLIVAHYDSKSQRMPLAARIFLFAMGMAGAMLFAILILLSPLAPVMVTPAMVLGGLALLAGVPLWFLDLGDDSPGAIDNASGVGVVMELAHALANDPQVRRKLDLIVLLTSAEEVSTMGAVAYVQRHEKELRRWEQSGHVYVFNFDGVGVNGPLRWVSKGELAALHSELLEPRLVSLVRQACKDLGCKIKSFNLPGALYDHLPFAALGLQAGTLVAVSRASLGVHTRRDSADKLALAGFEQAGQVALRVIAELVNSPYQRASFRNQP
jgi:hypothetical protein